MYFLYSLSSTAFTSGLHLCKKEYWIVRTGGGVGLKLHFPFNDSWTFNWVWDCFFFHLSNHVLWNVEFCDNHYSSKALLKCSKCNSSYFYGCNDSRKRSDNSRKHSYLPLIATLNTHKVFRFSISSCVLRLNKEDWNVRTVR